MHSQTTYRAGQHDKLSITSNNLEFSVWVVDGHRQHNTNGNAPPPKRDIWALDLNKATIYKYLSHVLCCFNTSVTRNILWECTKLHHFERKIQKFSTPPLNIQYLGVFRHHWTEIHNATCFSSGRCTGLECIAFVGQNIVDVFKASFEDRTWLRYLFVAQR